MKLYHFYIVERGNFEEGNDIYIHKTKEEAIKSIKEIMEISLRFRVIDWKEEKENYWVSGNEYIWLRKANIYPSYKDLF